jgi:hypothetical protein
MKRLQSYNDRLKAAQGHVDALGEVERDDLADLLRKWLRENEVPVNG